jgi:hypothetical protein
METFTGASARNRVAPILIRSPARQKQSPPAWKRILFPVLSILPARFLFLQGKLAALRLTHIFPNFII